MNPSLLVGIAPLFLRLSLLIQPPSILLLLNPSLLVGVTLLVLRLSFVVAALLVFGLSSLLVLRLSFVIAALIFSLAPLLVLRLSSLLLFLLIVLPLALSLILVVALLPLFADLRALLTPVRTILTDGDDTGAEQAANAKPHQYRNATKVIVFHDYPPARERG